MIAKNFKTGDKVVLVKPDRWHVEEMNALIGKEGVVHIVDGGQMHVLFPEDRFFTFDGSGLELSIAKPKAVRPKKGEHKFQIGDRVKVVKARVRGQHGGFDHGMEKYEKEGKIFTINELMPIGAAGRLGYRFEEDDKFSWDEQCLRRVRKAIVKDVPIAAPPAALKPAKPQVGQEAIIEAPVPVVEAPKVVRTSFKKGDRVICIDPGPKLDVGKEYEITKDSFQEEGGWSWLTEVMGKDSAFFITRFKHAIVYYEEQQIVAKAPVVVPKTPSLLESLRKKTGDNPGVCSYGLEMADGTFRMQARDVCHARMATQDKQGVVKLALDINGHNLEFKDATAQKNYQAYANYILNYSPWSHVFHRKGLDNALKHGILVDVEKPFYQCLGGAVALREGSEYSRKLTLFNLLLDKGYSGNTAYLLSSSVVGTLGTFRFVGLENCHKVLDGRQDAETLFKFFREGYVKKVEDVPYRTKHDYRPGIYTFISPVAKNDDLQINRILRIGMKVKLGLGWDVDLSIKDKAFFEYADTLETLLNK